MADVVSKAQNDEAELGDRDQSGMGYKACLIVQVQASGSSVPRVQTVSTLDMGLGSEGVNGRYRAT